MTSHQAIADTTQCSLSNAKTGKEILNMCDQSGGFETSTVSLQVPQFASRVALIFGSVSQFPNMWAKHG